MKVYKVVMPNRRSRKPETAFVSAIVNDLSIGLKYGIGVTTRPKYKSPIFAFEKLVDAIDFAKDEVRLNRHMAVLECDADPYTRKFNILQTRVICANFDSDAFKEFWRDPEQSPYLSAAPYGTVYCASVTPIKVVVEES